MSFSPAKKPDCDTHFTLYFRLPDFIAITIPFQNLIRINCNPISWGNGKSGDLISIMCACSRGIVGVFIAPSEPERKRKNSNVLMSVIIQDTTRTRMTIFYRSLSVNPETGVPV